MEKDTEANICMDPIIPKPEPGTYPAFYDSYFKMLEGDARPALEQLQKDGENFQRFILAVPKEKLLYAYAEGKWNVKQVIQHVIDTERIQSYRALCIARGEKQGLPGFNEDEYALVSKASVSEKPIELIALEFFAVRQATIALFIGLTPQETITRGMANNNAVSTNALAWMIVAHARHHFNVLVTRYLQ